MLERGERPIGLVALELRQKTTRVRPYACDELDPVRDLDQVVACTDLEGAALVARVFLRRQDDDGYGGRLRIRPEESHQRETVHVRHHEVLKNHGRAELAGPGQG